MQTNFSYRADIDGLRAVAVLAVFIFHLNPNWLAGGYLGVDIFFVISGFLITNIIYLELQDDSFSFVNFYTRRIKRILPVFFVVLVTGFLLSTYFMLPLVAQGMANSGLSSLLFIANFYFAQGQGYFDAPAQAQPFLHLWSLSVEEQFYFIFPFVLFFSFRKGFITRTLVILFAILLVVSAVDLQKFGFTSDSYYWSHLRFIELLAGAILAIFTAQKQVKLSKVANNFIVFFSVFGLVLLLVFGKKVLPPPNFYPGLNYLIPAIFSAGLIFANFQQNFIAKFLSSKPLVFVGKHSYSIYLWHYLILGFLRYLYGTDEPLSNTVILVASLFILALSRLSYTLVEQPARRLKFNFSLSAICFYLIPALLVLWQYRILNNYNDTDRMTFNLGRGPNLTWQVGYVKPKVLILGDSFGAHLAKFWIKASSKEHFSATIMSYRSCTFLFNYTTFVRLSEKPGCEQRNEQAKKIYKDYPIVVLSSFWGSKIYAKDTPFLPNLLQTIGKFLSEGKKVYVVNSSYEIDSNLKHIGKYAHLEYSYRKGEQYNQSVKNAKEVLNTIKAKYPQVRIIDLTPFLPDDFYYQGKSLIFDDHHLTDYGADYLADRYLENHRFIRKEDLN